MLEPLIHWAIGVFYRFISYMIIDYNILSFWFLSIPPTLRMINQFSFCISYPYWVKLIFMLCILPLLSQTCFHSVYPTLIESNLFSFSVVYPCCVKLIFKMNESNTRHDSNKAKALLKLCLASFGILCVWTFFQVWCPLDFGHQIGLGYFSSCGVYPCYLSLST